MKIFGYHKNSEDLIELTEISFQTTIEELDKLINFLNSVKEQHNSVRGKTELCHSHLRDWDLEWNDESTDIIVVTKFDNTRNI